MKRIPENVVDEVDLFVEGEDKPFASIELVKEVKQVICSQAIKQHQSLEVATERFLLGLFRDLARREQSRAQDTA